MTMELTEYQARVIGCMLEKEVTTPDTYPLTLNSLTTAANQKSNRDPVYSLSEADVLDTIESLISQRLVSAVEGFGSRVTKYQHRFCNTEFGSLQLSEQEKGIVCVMLLRGPQTPGELRTRTNRLCSFSDVGEVERVLSGLVEKGHAICLPREAGKRESRYAHTFCGDVEVTATIVGTTNKVSADDDRIEQLEREIDALRSQLSQLQQQVDSLIRD